MSRERLGGPVDAVLLVAEGLLRALARGPAPALAVLGDLEQQVVVLLGEDVDLTRDQIAEAVAPEHQPRSVRASWARPTATSRSG